MPKKSGHLRYTNDEHDDWQPPSVIRPDDAPAAPDESSFADVLDEEATGEDAEESEQ